MWQHSGACQDSHGYGTCQPNHLLIPHAPKLIDPSSNKKLKSVLKHNGAAMYLKYHSTAQRKNEKAPCS